MREALNALFTRRGQIDRASGALHALYASRLELADVTVGRGRARIELSGYIELGSPCDGPRYLAQIEQTARQFRDVREVEILIDGEPLHAVIERGALHR